MKATPLRVRVFFANDAHVEKRRIAQSLIACVMAHMDRPSVVTLSGHEVPAGISRIVLWRDDQSCWCNVEHRCVSVNEIFDQIAQQISAKSRLVPTYRANLPAASKMWLLLWSALTVSRGLPVPHGLDKWSVPFDFDRVFFCSLLDAQVIELARAGTR